MKYFIVFVIMIFCWLNVAEATVQQDLLVSAANGQKIALEQTYRIITTTVYTPDDRYTEPEIEVLATQLMNKFPEEERDNVTVVVEKVEE